MDIRILTMVRAVIITMLLVNGATRKGFSQSPQFMTFETHSLSSYGYTISHCDLDNSTILTGSFTGPYHDPDSSEMGGFISKYDHLGNLLWQHEYYSSGGSIMVLNTSDSDGNVYVAGSFYPDMYYSDTSFTGSGNFLFKYDSNGNLLWQDHVPKSKTLRISLLPSGEVIVTGHIWKDSLYHGIPVNADGFIAKYTADGTFVSVNEIYAPYSTENAFDMTTDDDGNIYTAGCIAASNFICDSVSIPSQGSHDGFIAKYDTNLQLMWVRTICGPQFEIVKTVQEGHFGDVYIAGEYNAVLGTNLDSMLITAPDNSGDLFVAKYNVLGSVQWVRTISGDGVEHIRDITLDENDNIFLTGSFGFFGDSVVFGDQVVMSTEYYNADAFIASYDSAGNFRWVLPSTSGGGEGRAIVSDQQGSLYVTGAFGGSFTIGGASVTAESQTFLLKLSDISTTTEDLSNPENFFSVFPNPSTGQIQILRTTTAGSKDRIIVYDVMGDQIKNFSDLHSNQLTIDLSSESKGMYFIELIADGVSSVKRIVVQ
jgi:hypothetical protein